MPAPAQPTWTIAAAQASDLDELVVLIGAYCDFYRASSDPQALRELCRALIADPEHEGVQLIAREQDSRAVGFATIYWSWSTTAAARIGVMNDLFVTPDARGTGVAQALIEGCLERCERRGAAAMEWQTAPENARAQALYERVGGQREDWLTYVIDLPRERRP